MKFHECLLSFTLVKRLIHTVLLSIHFLYLTLLPTGIVRLESLCRAQSSISVWLCAGHEK